jgi:hypothetical protein
VLGYDNTWREVHVRGDVGGERVVVLADGRIVVLSPPDGYVSPPRITVLDKGRATTLPIVFPSVTTDVARVLRLGLWLDGFEERRPGVVGGWLESGGVMLGLEIRLDGHATPGQFIRDAGMPFVSGKYGLGWTASRRGFETVDGGMTWSSIEVPDPLVPWVKVERRACGPIGCLAHGWLRVGWGEPKRPPSPAVPAAYRPSAILSAPHLQLSCEPVAGAPPPPSQPKTRVASTPPSSSSRIRLGSFGGAPVLGTFQGLTDLPPFFTQAAPPLHESERGLNLEVKDMLDRYPTVGTLARVYGWGPKSGEWETLGRWQVKWLSPFSGWPDVRTSLPALPPQMIIDLTRGGYPYGYGGSGRSDFQLVPGDDPGHAFLIGKRVVRSESVPFELEADRAPVEIRRADGEPWGDVDGVVRAAGRWFVATPLATSISGPATIIWQIEGAVARELVRVPRALGESSTQTGWRTKLARRSDGRAIALVVDGQPTADRAVSTRWALPIDLESGALGEPEPLGYADLAGSVLEGCTDDVVGWALDTAMPSSTVRIRLPNGSGSINSVQARLRLTSARACVEKIAGIYDGQSAERAAQLTRPGAPRAGAAHGGEIAVTAMSAQTRFPLRCSIAR